MMCRPMLLMSYHPGVVLIAGVHDCHQYELTNLSPDSDSQIITVLCDKLHRNNGWALVHSICLSMNIELKIRA